MKTVDKIIDLSKKIDSLEKSEKLSKSKQLKLSELKAERDEIIYFVSDIFKRNFKKRKTELDAQYQDKTETMRKQLRTQYELQVETTKSELEKQHETYYRSVFTALNEIQNNFTSHNLAKATEITKRILTQHNFPELIQRAKDAGFTYNHRRQIFYVPSESINEPVVADLMLYNIAVQITM